LHSIRPDAPIMSNNNSITAELGKRFDNFRVYIFTLTKKYPEIKPPADLYKIEKMTVGEFVALVAIAIKTYGLSTPGELEAIVTDTAGLSEYRCKCDAHDLGVLGRYCAYFFEIAECLAK
jgi:hypothetical protein